MAAPSLAAKHALRRVQKVRELCRIEGRAAVFQWQQQTTRMMMTTTMSTRSPIILQRPFRAPSLKFFSSAQPSVYDESEEPEEPSSTTTSQASSSPKYAVISKEDVYQEETKRRRLSEVLISEVLKAKHSYRWVDPVIRRTATVQEAIVATIEGGLSGMMALEEDHNRVVGLLTSRDLLRIMASGIKEGEPGHEVLNQTVGEFMTPISQVIYARPDETIGMCRTLMAKLGIKCLPILSWEGRVEGLITARDMSDYGLTAKDKGGKKSFLDDVSERVGLSSNISMAEPPSYLQGHLALDQAPLFVNIGEAHLPHPFKTINGVGKSQRGMDHSDDPDLSEDAHFYTTVTLPDKKDQSILRQFTYLGVADGVGSWREYGVDPREFSRRLMDESRNMLEEAASMEGVAVSEGQKFRRAVTPAEIMAQAYERVKAENVIGSSTACIALFDGIRHQLHFSNLGDSGIIVLRHIDSDIAGALKRDRKKPRSERTSDLQISFVSQQQLRSFNHPWQLGWTGEDLPVGEESSFKTANESSNTSIHLRRGDIVIMATDGLFDNVDVDDICEVALEWEQKHGFIRCGDIVALERRWSMGNSLSVLSSETISELAENLANRARENSLNSEVDSPFAILAKENDIMWSGGMPDDCTVIAVHVVGRDAKDTMDQPKM